MAPLPVDKLAKLIPMLSSDMDGEVVAASRAIMRALKSAGCDIHDLTKAITAPAQPVQTESVKNPYPPRQSYPEPAREDEAADWYIIELYSLDLLETDLSEKEEGFVLQMRQLLLRRGDDFSMSAKQRKWFLDIVNRMLK